MKQLLLRPGFQSWFEYQMRCGADVATVSQDTLVTVEPFNGSWWRTVGAVDGFPGCPPILVNLSAELQSVYVEEVL